MSQSKRLFHLVLLLVIMEVLFWLVACGFLWVSLPLGIMLLFPYARIMRKLLNLLMNAHKCMWVQRTVTILGISGAFTCVILFMFLFDKHFCLGIFLWLNFGLSFLTLTCIPDYWTRPNNGQRDGGRGYL